MGLFDFFSGKKGSDGVLKKHAARVADKRAQAPDRWDAIQALGKLIAESRKAGAAEGPETARRAVEALLARFAFYVDPSITDQDEKEEVARYVADAGDHAVDPVIALLRRSDSVGWGLKLLERLLPAERVVGELLELLSTMDTEYERDPMRKQQVLQTLEDRRDPRIAAAAKRFLEDVNETARFHAIGAVFAQDDAETAREELTKALAREDSVRARARILEGFAERRWSVGTDRAAIEKALPGGFALDKDGVPKRR